MPPQIDVTINGRDYRLACEAGQEERLKQLADRLDKQVVKLKGSFGEIGDIRLAVMAALTVIDELDEANKRVAALEDEIAALRGRRHEDQTGEAEDIIVEALTGAAERIERLTASLGAGPN